MPIRFIILYKKAKDLSTTFKVVTEVSEYKAIQKLCIEQDIPNKKIQSKDSPEAGIYSVRCLDEYFGING